MKYNLLLISILLTTPIFSQTNTTPQRTTLKTILPVEDPTENPNLPTPPVTNPATCTIPSGASAFTNLQGHIPSNCYSGVGSWWALPKNGGILNINAEACKTNIWYLCVVGDRFSLSGYEARTAGVHGMTGTPSAPITINSSIPDYTAGICNGQFDPFHGVKISPIGGLQNFSYQLLQERPLNGTINKCEIGVYKIIFSPQAVDAGKIYQVKVTAQILVTPFEFASGSYIRESPQIDWTVNISVITNPNCPQVSVSINPNTSNLVYGESKQFTATVVGTNLTQVNWSTDGGTISAAGLYIAPNSPGNYTIKATSIADPSKFATASANVSPNYSPVFSTTTPTSFHSSYGQGTACSSPVLPTPVVYQFQATDPNGHPIVFRIEHIDGTSTPNNLSLSPSGLFNWDGYPALGNDIEYYYIVASDNKGGTTKWKIALAVALIPAPPCGDPISN